MAADPWPIIHVPGGWDSLMEESARGDLERNALPRFLQAQRWFGSKSLPLEALSIRDWLPVIEEPFPAFLVIVEARYGDGRRDFHDVPLAITAGVEATARRNFAPKSVVATLKGPLGEAILYDATAGDRFCLALFDRIARGENDPSETSPLQGLLTRAFPADASTDRLEPVTRGSEEQSNTTVVFHHRYLLKMFRKLEPGLNPDFEIGRFLTERTTFDRIPKTFGALQFSSATGTTATLAVLQEFIPNAVQAWEWMLGILRTLFEEARFDEVRDDRLETHESLDPIAISERETPKSALERFGPARRPE